MEKGVGNGIIAGFLSALLALVINTKLADYSKRQAITLGAPVIEEILKTGMAVLFGGSVILSHLCFGIAEAVYDVARKRDIRSYFAGVTAVLSHALFGAAAVWTMEHLRSVVSGILVSFLLHISWNRWVIRKKE
ncbi:MAG: hypothetical protein L5655_06460 [Thermosediminibacteraceae bacterium]|nr:hypothetical protein [Thermosediminibacteraceae bacterium]